MNPLKKLQDYGQSVYMDELSRHILESGLLEAMVERDGLRGVTSNPAIFQKAIADSNDYDEDIRRIAKTNRDIDELYEAIVIDDIQRAADTLRGVYDRSGGRYGFVSLEVSPHLAHDTEGTIAEAHRLWNSVARPNAFIKIPGTKAGLPAIQQCLAEGININITLLFGLPRYREVAEAYLAALETRAQKGLPLENINSVASFFLSRIDVKVDKMLNERIDQGGENAGMAKALRGQVAVASAKVAYQIYKEIFGSQRFSVLANKGAKTQRLLWASTSTKNPDYNDVKYVEALIGPETINTMPRETLDAYRDHGQPAERLEGGADEARRMLERLPQVGIDLDRVTQELEDEGVDKFIKPFDSLMDTLRTAVEATPA